MKDWRTTLGGALGSLGTSLAGLGSVVAITSGDSPQIRKISLWALVAGTVVSALAKFFTALWTPDKQQENPTAEKLTETQK